MRRILFALAAAAIIVAPALAFHDGGVAHCNGCHTMHNSQDGSAIDTDLPVGSGNPWLLLDGSPSDVCLGCHATRLGAVYYDTPATPATERGAGNFIFLDEDNLNDGHGGATDPIPGDAAGHNLWAPGTGIAPDATITLAPGGSFPASQLGCSSCHDPHGTDSFRLLYGIGPIQDGLYTFTSTFPTAEGLGLFGPGESQTNHTAYQGGMSAWCGNCHGAFHDGGSGNGLIHPSGSAIGGTIATTYNLYNGTIDQLGGAQATAYLAEVPFEDAANTTSSTDGPSAGSQVSCISCHRAHATSAPDAGRWDFNVTFLHEDGVESGSYQIPDPYNNLNQRSLCNKCHNKDANDANPF